MTLTTLGYLNPDLEIFYQIGFVDLHFHGTLDLDLNFFQSGGFGFGFEH